MQPTTLTCKNCGQQFQGNYCNYCGEKVYHAHDKKFSHFAEEIFHFITHFDNKFFRSFWLMFTNPGFLAREFSEGKRKYYFSPVSLFMIGVVIYLLFPLLQGMNDYYLEGTSFYRDVFHNDHNLSANSLFRRDAFHLGLETWVLWRTRP